jgi:PAS domain S-box-containing protein
MPVGCVMNAPDLSVTYWNPAAERIFGFTRDEVIGRSPFDTFVPPEDRPKVEEILGRVAAGERNSGASGHVTKDGRRIVCEWHNTPLTDDAGRFVGFLSMCQDVTDRARAEAEREGLIRRLEDQNAEMARFVYTVSHDLKSPLITVKGFLAHLAKAARAGSWDRFDADLDRVARAADKMQQLLDDLLALSRVGRVANPPRDVPVGEAVAEALAQLAGPVAARGVTVVVQPDLPAAHADPARLVEVFANLIGNAVKFLGPQPTPRVEVGFRGSDRAFYVKDNGVGIAPAYHDRVFNLFERLDPRTEGTGVGLAIVKRIVEVHGGRVWVESGGAGQGAAFCFTLPPSRGPVRGPPASGESRQEASTGEEPGGDPHPAEAADSHGRN